MKTHYAPSGEWGNLKTTCIKYFTSDVNHTGVLKEVTCKNCIKSIYINTLNK